MHTEADTGKEAKSALRAYFRIAQLWGLTLREERTLLGNPPPWAFLRWKLTHTGTPNAEAIERISYVLGIFRALEVLLPAPASAGQWMRKLNFNPKLGGRRPLDLVLDEGASGLCWLLAYLDAQAADEL
jgi:hypothetical protein